MNGRRIVDAALTALLLCLMAYQVTGEALNMAVPADSGNDAPSWTPQPEQTESCFAPTASEPPRTAGKVLIAYFSWGGNTRGVAQEIARQTGADVFEISPVHPYSTNYNTVLMEAQEDQHRQARPELSAHVANMDAYDTILLGYPNWWASIPMPIASFLEEYDFADKRIVPFCSHGGGRFGQSLTAIAKLAPDADLGEGLSVHYSGGSTLSEDVSNWLKTNGII